MRVKKYKTIFCVNLTAGILLLFTLDIFAMTIKLDTGRDAGGTISPQEPQINPYVDPYNYFNEALQIDVEPFKPENLDNAFQELQRQLDISYPDLGDLDSIDGVINELGEMLNKLDQFYSDLYSKLDEINFSLSAIEESLSRWHTLYHLIQSESQPVSSDFLDVGRELQRRRGILVEAKEKIQSQISEINEVYNIFTELNISFPDYAPDVLAEVQTFSQELISALSKSSQSDLTEKQAEIKNKLDYIQSQMAIISYSIEVIDEYQYPTDSSFSGVTSRKILSMVKHFLEMENNIYQQAQQILIDANTRVDLEIQNRQRTQTQETSARDGEQLSDGQIVLQSSGNISNSVKDFEDKVATLYNLMKGKYSFLFDPEFINSPVICYLGELIRLMPLEERLLFLEKFADFYLGYDIAVTDTDRIAMLNLFNDIKSGIEINEGLFGQLSQQAQEKLSEILKAFGYASGTSIREFDRILRSISREENFIDHIYNGDALQFVELHLQRLQELAKAVTENPQTLSQLSISDAIGDSPFAVDFIPDVHQAIEILSSLVDEGVLGREELSTYIGYLQRIQDNLDPSVVQAAQTISLAYDNLIKAQQIQHQLDELYRELDSLEDPTNGSSGGSWGNIVETITELQQQRDVLIQSATSLMVTATSTVNTISPASEEPVVNTQSVGDSGNESGNGGSVTVSTQSQEGSESTTDITGTDTTSKTTGSPGDEYSLTPQQEGDDSLVRAQAAGPQDPGGNPDSGLTPGQKEGSPSQEQVETDQLLDYNNEDSSFNPEAFTSPHTDFAQEGFGKDPGPGGERGEEDIGGVVPTIFGGDHGITGGNENVLDHQGSENSSIPGVSEDTIKDYLIEIGDRIFDANQPYTNYSEINVALAQFVFTIPGDEMDLNSNGFSEIDEETYNTKFTKLEGFFRSVEGRLNRKIEAVQQLTSDNKEILPQGQTGIESIEGVRILGVIGVAVKNGKIVSSGMVVRAQSEVSKKGVTVRNGEGADKDGAVSEEGSRTGGGEHAQGVTRVLETQGISPDKAYVVNIERAIAMIQSGENIDRICEETGLSKDVVEAIQEAWKNGTILKNSTGAYIVVEVVVKGEKKIVVIPADTIVYITSTKPSEIVKEIIKKVFLKKPQASDVTVNRILILLILLAVVCMAGGIALAVVVTRREYRRWLEYQPPVYKKPSRETKPVYTKFVTGYHGYYKK